MKSKAELEEQVLKFQSNFDLKPTRKNATNLKNAKAELLAYSIPEKATSSENVKKQVSNEIRLLQNRFIGFENRKSNLIFE